VLMHQMGCPAPSAIAAANAILAQRTITLAPGIFIGIDVAAVSAQLDERILDAVQAEPRRARGRPRRSPRE
jgi:hypothetical protein